MGDDKETFEEKLSELKQTVQFLQTSLNEAVEGVETNEKVSKSKDTTSRRIQEEEREDDEDRQKREQTQKVKEYAKGRTDEINDIWTKTNQKVDDIIVLNEETIEIGKRTQQKLKEQTEKMQKIQADLDDLGDGLKRARKELK
jgi:hypothetical protein